MTALLDGRLSPEDEERYWSHVFGCPPCRDLVEREGWIKTRLAAWSGGEPAAPDGLKSALLTPEAGAWHGPSPAGWNRPSRGVLFLGGGMAGAVGAAVVGILALGVAPAEAPLEEDPPLADISGEADRSWADVPAVRLEETATHGMRQEPVRGTRPATPPDVREKMAQ